MVIALVHLLFICVILTNRKKVFHIVNILFGVDKWRFRPFLAVFYPWITELCSFSAHISKHTMWESSDFHSNPHAKAESAEKCFLRLFANAKLLFPIKIKEENRDFSVSVFLKCFVLNCLPSNERIT